MWKVQGWRHVCPDQIKISHYSHVSFPWSFTQEGQAPTQRRENPAKMWIFDHHVSHNTSAWGRCGARSSTTQKTSWDGRKLIRLPKRWILLCSSHFRVGKKRCRRIVHWYGSFPMSVSFQPSIQPYSYGFFSMVDGWKDGWSSLGLTALPQQSQIHTWPLEPMEYFAIFSLSVIHCLHISRKDEEGKRGIPSPSSISSYSSHTKWF